MEAGAGDGVGVRCRRGRCGGFVGGGLMWVVGVGRPLCICLGWMGVGGRFVFEEGWMGGIEGSS